MSKAVLRWPVLGLSAVLIAGCHHEARTPATFGIERGTKRIEGHRHPTADDQAVAAADQRFYDALTSMFQGDMGPMDAVWAHTPDVSLMSPYGGRQLGWEQVRAELQKEANKNMAGRVYLEAPIVRVDPSGDNAYVTGFERGDNFTMNGKPVNISLRSTSVFRKEGGKWLMVHHQSEQAPELINSATAQR